MSMGLDSLRKDLNRARFERSNSEHEAELQEIIASLKTQSKYKDYTDEELREIAQEMPSKRLKGYAESLKKQDKYKDFSDDELLIIAAAKIAKNNTSIIGDDIHYSVLNPEKPSDPIWSQYDYEQILNMASEGVNVPKEFLDWANAMADSNITAYDLETDSSGDANDADNLNMSTDEDNQLARQQKLVRYASKAEQQGAFLEQANRTIQSDKTDIEDNRANLEREQAQAAEKIQKLTEEYNILNQKIANGESVSDADMQRFKELGTILNVQQQELMTKSKNFEAELKTLVSQMNSFNTVASVNDNINDELANLSLLYSGEEGGKRHSYTQAMLNSVVVGDVAAYAYMVQGMNITTTATTISNNLQVLTNNFKASLNNNLDVANNFNIKANNNNSKANVENNTDTNNQATLSATDEVSTDTVDETSDTSDVSETSDVQDGAETTQDSEEVAMQKYIEDCSSKSSEMQTQKDSVTALKNQVQDLQKSRLADTVRSTAEFNKSLKSLEKLIGRIRNADSVSDKDMAEFQSLSSVLDSQNGTIATDMQAKIELLDGFSSAVKSSLEFSNETSDYADNVVEAGKAYAQEHIKYSVMMLRMASSKSEKYDILYGKSGESIARDVIDNGEALANQAIEAQNFLNSTAGLQTFAGQYSGQLTEKLSANDAKVTPLADEFEQIVAEKSSNTNNADNSDKTNSTSKKEEATQDDINNVEDKGRSADKEAKEAKRDGQEALSDKEKCERDIKKNTMQMKQTKSQINKLTKENISNNVQIAQLHNQAENEAKLAAEEGSANSDSGLTSRSSNSTSTTSSAEEHLAIIDTLTAQSEKLGTQVTTNGSTINVLVAKSERTNKAIAKSYNAKYKYALQEQKQKEEDAQKNQKVIQTVTDVGKLFTTTKLTGLALMLMPWSAAAGTIMYNIGKYGEITSYVTNASLNVAQGNLLGAGINLGAAALSFASAAPTSSAATEGVKESAKEGLKEAGKEAGKEVATETGKEVAKEAVTETSKEAVKDVATEGAKEVAKDVGAETVKDATTEIVKDTTSTTLQSSVQSIAPDGLGVFSSTVSTAGVGEAMKEVSEKVSQQIAAEAAKTAAKEQMKNTVKNTLVSTAQQSLLKYGEKLQQKDTTTDKKKKVLTEFERKRRNEIRKGIEKIKKTMNAK